MSIVGKGSHAASIEKALTECKKRGEKYSSMAEMCRAIGIIEYTAQVAVRQHFRKAGLGVGRGNRYSGVTPAKVASVVTANAKQAKATAPAKKAADVKAAKATTVKPPAAEPVPA